MLPLIPILIAVGSGMGLGFFAYDKGMKDGFREGYEKEKAEHAIEAEKLKKQYEDIYEEVLERRISEACYRAYFAMAMAFVNCDELITQETEQIIKDTITGVGYKAIPAQIRDSVETLFTYGKTHGIAVEEAIEFVEKTDPAVWDGIDATLEVLWQFTNQSKAKLIFLDQWWRFKSGGVIHLGRDIA